jgi:hypothetical protein
MDTDSSPHGPGGTVEPGNRAQVARDVFQMPRETLGIRYELRDPFAEVTYRVDSFKDMAAKADQLGAVRFHAVHADGSRHAIEKSEGKWKEPKDRAAPATSRAPLDADRPNVIPLTSSPTAPHVRDTALAKIDLDAERAARVARLEQALIERYVVKRAAVRVGNLAIGQTEYRYRGDANRVAFTETTFRLSTDTNQPSVARSMVDVAEARNWQSVRVSGNEDFKRLVWLEASLRGVRALGYEPQLADQELLKRERESRAVNRVEPLPSPERTSGVTGPSGDSATRQSARGSGGRKAVLVALEAVLVSKGVPPKRRDAVLAAAAENLAARLREGQVHKVKVFDRDAPSQRVVPTPARDIQPARERTTINR